MDHAVCALCGGANSTVLFAKWGLKVVRCESCTLAYVNPRRFVIEDDEYFRGPYLSTVEANGRLEPGVELIYNRIAGHLETQMVPSRLLDVGCAMGHFMALMKTRGWSVHGVECSPFAAAYGRERWALPVQTACDLRDARLPSSFFDVCTLVKVVEHLPFPRETLQAAFRLLKPGGIVYLTTPNFASFASILLGVNWSDVIPTGHLYYFTLRPRAGSCAK